MSDNDSTGSLFDIPAKKKRYPGGGRPLRDINEAEMIALCQEGHSCVAIGEAVGCHSETVRRRLKQLGIPIKRTRVAKIILEKGQRFAMLSVVNTFLKRAGIDNMPRTFVECRCDCGKTVIVRASNLTRGNNTSCGCKPRAGKDHPTWKGYGEISGLFWNNLRRTAAVRKDPAKREFTVTIEEAWELFIRQNGFCALSGLPIKFARSAEGKQKRREQTASLDRIDSTKGYTIDNIQWTHRDVNCIKTDMPEDRFIELCCLVADWQRQKTAELPPASA